MILLALFFFFILATGTCLVLLVTSALKAKHIIPLDSVIRREKIRLQKRHIYWVKWYYLMALISVLLIIMVVAENNGRWGPMWLQETHMVLTKILSPLLILTLIFNGKKYPKMHVVCVYAQMLAFAPTLITGMCLSLLHPLLFG
jgi:hypothetical protein